MRIALGLPTSVDFLAFLTRHILCAPFPYIDICNYLLIVVNAYTIINMNILLSMIRHKVVKNTQRNSLTN